jgi:MgtC family
VKYEGRRARLVSDTFQVGGVRPTGVILKFSITKVPECPPGCSIAFRELMMSLIQYSSVLNILTKGWSLWTPSTSPCGSAATLVGAVLGLNRDLHGKPTGVRTLGLVCLGSALAVLSIQDGSSTDASRIVQGIMTGVGFLGAGVIVRNRAKVITYMG